MPRTNTRTCTPDDANPPAPALFAMPTAATDTFRVSTYSYYVKRCRELVEPHHNQTPGMRATYLVQRRGPFFFLILPPQPRDLRSRPARTQVGESGTLLFSGSQCSADLVAAPEPRVPEWLWLSALTRLLALFSLSFCSPSLASFRTRPSSHQVRRFFG